MLFNSFVYALFLPIVLGLFLASRGRPRQLLMVAASYVFYCWETPVYGLLLATSTVLDFSVGLLLARATRTGVRRGLLCLSLLGNLGMLGFFKYVDFFGTSLTGLGQLLGFDTTWEPYNFLLPVGISFYTFQTLSYSIEIYRRQMEPERDFATFALFVAFFPQLVAGPIERASHLLPQLRTWRPRRPEDFRIGIQRIISGLFMKLVIADRLAIFVDLVNAHPDHYHPAVLWCAAACFSGQIYMDFAGYASIAIGTARLFGVNLVENFNHPMAARDVADFWARWHMSLTTWLRDYVYISMGGSRKGSVRTVINGMVVLILCGLWHGAEWHFVVWGCFMAVWMTIVVGIRSGRKGGAKKMAQEYGLRPLPWVVFTLTVNTVGGVLFRAPNLPHAGGYLKAMFGFGSNTAAPVEWYVWVFALLVLALMIYDYVSVYVPAVANRRRRVHWALAAFGYGALAAITVLGAVNSDMPYIYFQF